MITQHSWMFLGSYEKLRSTIYEINIINMVHLGARAFEEIGGEVVQTTSFVLREANIRDYKSLYVRLVAANSQQKKEEVFLSRKNRYIAQQDNFSRIPGFPIAYWASNNVIKAFARNPLIDDLFETRNGMSTTNNNMFLRMWFECEIIKCGLGNYTAETAKKSEKNGSDIIRVESFADGMAIMITW